MPNLISHRLLSKLPVIFQHEAPSYSKLIKPFHPARNNFVELQLIPGHLLTGRSVHFCKVYNFKIGRFFVVSVSALAFRVLEDYSIFNASNLRLMSRRPFHQLKYFWYKRTCLINFNVKQFFSMNYLLVFVLLSSGIVSYAALMGIPNPAKAKNGFGNGKILVSKTAFGASLSEFIGKRAGQLRKPYEP